MNYKIEKLSIGINKELFEFAQYNANNEKLSNYLNYSYWRSTIYAFSKNKIALFFLYLVIILMIFTIIQPYLPYQKSPIQIFIDENTGMQLRNHKPNSEFYFGTDRKSTRLNSSHL